MIRASRTIVIALTLFATTVTAGVARADEGAASTETTSQAEAKTDSETKAPAEAKSPSEEAKTTTAKSAAKPAQKPAPKAAERKTAETKAATTETTGATVAPPPPAAPEPAPSATPLVLRETADSHALTLAPPPASNAAWKIVAFLALAAAGAWAWKKKGEQKKPLETVKSLQVLRRLAVGVRSELLVVDVDGQRLLIGVTPSSMQTLASLPDLEPEEMNDPLAIPTSTMSDRLAALVDSSRAITISPQSTRTTIAPKRTSKRPSKKSAAAHAESEELEGQARGLAKIGQR